MFIARHYLNNARSIGAQCRHQLHFAPNGANHLCGGRAINMLSSGAKTRSAKYVTALLKVAERPRSLNDFVGFNLATDEHR